MEFTKRPSLDVRHLEMIAALAQSPRVTDAAERLRITPSALSHRLTEVERRLGVTLFERVQRRLRPTPAAGYLARVSARLLSELARAESDVRHMARGTRHVTRLAVEAYSAYGWLPAFLRHLRADEADIGIEVVASAARDTLSRVRDRSVDVVLVTEAPVSPDLYGRPLFEDELVFVMAPDHPLAGRPWLDGPDIRGEAFITFSRVPAPDREYARLFRPSGTFPDWTETVEVPEAIVELVAAGLGVSVMSAWAMSEPVRNGRVVTARAGQAGLPIRWWAVTRAAGDGSKHGDEPEAEHHRAAVDALAQWCSMNGGLARE